MFVHINNTYADTYRIVSELRKANKLKEKELIQLENRRKRDEWLDFLRNYSDEALIRLLNDTEEYVTYTPEIKGGVGDVVLFKLPEQTEVNHIYIDIKNECIIRGLI